MDGVFAEDGKGAEALQEVDPGAEDVWMGVIFLR